MVIYPVAIVDTSDYYPEYIDVHYASCYAGAIKFLEVAIADEKSGIHLDTLIDIGRDYVDRYFDSDSRSIARKTVREFLAEGVDTSEAKCIMEP